MNLRSGTFNKTIQVVFMNFLGRDWGYASLFRPVGKEGEVFLVHEVYDEEHKLRSTRPFAQEIPRFRSANVHGKRHSLLLRVAAKQSFAEVPSSILICAVAYVHKYRINRQEVRI